MREYISSLRDRRRVYRRLATLGPVLLLHIGLLIALLHVNRSLFNGTNLSDHELIFLLKPAPIVPDWQGDMLPPYQGGSIALLRFVRAPVQMYKPFTARPEDITSDLQGVSQSQFRCWPGSLSPSTQAQEMQCISLAPHQSFDLSEPREESRDAARWLLARDRRNAPLFVPCWNGISLATVSCVANGLVNGFDLDDQTGYIVDGDQEPVSGIDTIRHEMQTVDPCALDRTQGFGFVCLYRVVNGNTPP